MCRLFVQHGSAGQDLGEPLCTAENALRAQSHRHQHGWGIGWYGPDGSVRVRRGLMPAHADDAFAEAVRAARSEIVVAHVRDASVGPVVEANTHPFVHGRWLFAHNGTVARFRHSAQLRSAIEAEIAPRLRIAIRGETDSERCMLLFLTELEGLVSPRRVPRLEDVRAALAATVALIVRLADAPGEKPSSLNLAVTNGDVLAVCRHGRALQVAAHIETSGLLAVASEPIGAGSWWEVPEDSFVGIDAEHRVVIGPLYANASAPRAAVPAPHAARPSRRA